MPDHRPVSTGIATRCWFGVMLVCGLSGCALIHETGESIPQIQPEQIRLADGIHLARDGWPSARWWTAYGDPQLDALINQALNEAPTMAVARSKVDKARAQVELAQAVTGLQIQATVSVDRLRASSGGVTGPLTSVISALTPGPWFTTGIAGFAGGYEIDVWGKHRQQIDAVIGLQNAQLAEQAAVELEISTDVAQLYYGIQTTLHTLDLLQQSHEIVAATVVAHAARASRGLESKTLTEEARAEQFAIERLITSARNMVRQQREALRSLVGAHADNLPEIAKMPLPSIQTSLPATLSYDLLARRPDLQAMRWYVEATVSEIGASKAAFYPSFDIKAFFGYTSLFADDLFRSENKQVNIIPGLTLPIFDGGRLNANLKSATAANNAAIAQYNQAVLDAVRDVAAAGTHLQGLDEEERLQTEKINALTFAVKSADAHYRQGLANKVTALNARLPVNAEEIALLGIRGDQISQSIALVKALGGGYHADQ